MTRARKKNKRNERAAEWTNWKKEERKREADGNRNLRRWLRAPEKGTRRKLIAIDAYREMIVLLVSQYPHLRDKL